MNSRENIRLSTRTYGKARRPQDLALHKDLPVAAVHFGRVDLRVGTVVGHEHLSAEGIDDDVLRIVQVEVQRLLEPRVLECSTVPFRISICVSAF